MEPKTLWRIPSCVVLACIVIYDDLFLLCIFWVFFLDICPSNRWSINLNISPVRCLRTDLMQWLTHLPLSAGIAGGCVGAAGGPWAGAWWWSRPEPPLHHCTSPRSSPPARANPQADSLWDCLRWPPLRALNRCSRGWVKEMTYRVVTPPRSSSPPPPPS